MKHFIAQLRKANAVVLDTETTGLDNRAEILQVGIVSLEGQVLFSSLVRPVGAKRWDDAMRVHQISPQDVIGAPTIGQLAAPLRNVIQGRPVAIYNADFDTRMFWQSIAAARAHDRFTWLQDQEWVCVMKAYAAYWGQRNNRYGGYRWQKLANACRQQGVTVIGAHDAVGDAKLTAAVIRAMEQKLSSE